MLINLLIIILELGIVNITSDQIYDVDLQLSRIKVTWGLLVSITNKYLVGDWNLCIHSYSWLKQCPYTCTLLI